MKLILRLSLLGCLIFFTASSNAQLTITPAGSAQALAQKLVGDGISISNVSFTGDAAMLMAGHFNDVNHANVLIDSGIVLTSGRAKTAGTNRGVDGPASGLASNDWLLPGDPALAAAVGIPVSSMNDACVLEFDFVPLGDTVKFRYVFSSEEYTPAFACPTGGLNYNDVFGFFISGPGITGLNNIALVPGTTLPVSIFNVNNVVNSSGTPLCPNNPQYFVNNVGNNFFTHDGHTQVLAAISRVQPCQTYHLKLVISDVEDGVWDSGVFLEAKSLSSNAVSLINNTQVSQQGESYLVEGCVPGSFTIRRPVASPSPLVVNLQYSGTAINGVDVQTMPATVTIPANQTDVVVSIIPIIDNIPEGIETVKVYSLAACASATALPIDSTTFQIRDYDTLGILPDTAFICRNASVQLTATAGYTTYNWTPAAGLSDPSIRNPVATPTSHYTTYIATADIGTCHGKDSAYLEWKVPELVSTQNVNCNGGTTGQIIVSGGPEWAIPIQYSIDGQPYQNSGTFNNLAVGNHIIRVNDGSCIDSIAVPVLQAFPDLLIANNPAVSPGNCTGGLSGSITVIASGGRPPYQYSSDGTTYQTGNVLTVAAGTYTITIKDANGCTKTMANVVVPFVNSVVLATGADPVICESKNTILPATATATSVVWTPTATLDNPNILNPVASPVVTTKYYITATTGVCSKTDSVTVIVNPAPRPNAGPDASICFGGTTNLNASGAMEYIWRPGTFLSSTTVAQPDVIRPSAPITYYLKVKDFNGCESLVEDTVKVAVTPAVKMFAGNDTLVAVGQPLQLTGSQVGANTVIAYSWSPAYGLNNPNVANPVAILDRDMTFTLTGRTAINCEGSDVINVKVYQGPEIYVPSVFTPNGDGTNDYLRAWAIGMKEYRYFRVYNRWGAMVFSTSDFNRGWDGKINGAAQNSGTYVWMAEAVDYKGNVITRKGTTTIIQ